MLPLHMCTYGYVVQVEHVLDRVRNYPDTVHDHNHMYHFAWTTSYRVVTFQTYIY